MRRHCPSPLAAKTAQESSATNASYRAPRTCPDLLLNRQLVRNLVPRNHIRRKRCHLLLLVFRLHRPLQRHHAVDPDHLPVLPIRRKALVTKNLLTNLRRSLAVGLSIALLLRRLRITLVVGCIVGCVRRRDTQTHPETRRRQCGRSRALPAQ